MSYLNQFQFFQANERISPGRIPAMDSLAQTEPVATLTVDDINIQGDIRMQIFQKRSQDPFHLLIDPNNEMIAVDAPRVNGILRKKSDFNGIK